MSEALNEITTIVVNAAIVGIGAMVGKWLNAWANKNKSEADSNQMNDLRDVARIATDYVEQWAKTLVKEGVGKPTSAQKIDSALDWVSDYYPRLAKNKEQVRGFVEAVIREMKESEQRWDKSVASGVEAAVNEMKEAE